jgi:hypothetical protein
MRPSIIGQFINGILILFATYLIIFNSKKFDDVYKTIIIVLLLSISIGIHTILHHIEEINYDFNPLVGKWKIRNDPIDNRQLNLL